MAKEFYWNFYFNNTII